MLRPIILTLALVGVAGAGPNPAVASKQRFIADSKVKIGMTLSSGGSIF